ncbi:MAG: DUF308 domain-containing protein [Beijerinckiaceae bacterium]|nr:DUF308 domain-containing protein [Beijerinckiaceae bacterium]
MSQQTEPQAPKINPETVAALERLVPRSRQLLVTGVTLIVLGTAAITILAVSSIISLVPIGLILLLGALLEIGVGHHARAEDGPLTPWLKSGMLLGFVGLCTVTAPLLHSILFTILTGMALMAAGWVRLRATSFSPLQKKSAVVPVSASLSILIGVLLITRWAGDNITATGNLLALELVATGWGLVGLSMTLNRYRRN